MQPTALPYDYTDITAMPVNKARAELLEYETPVVPLTQYRDCGDGKFVVMSDVLTRILRPLSHANDYLHLVQFDGILLKVEPIREFLRYVPRNTQLRCHFTEYMWTLQGERFTTGRGWEVDAARFGLMVEYTLDGLKSRSFFACVDMKFFKARKENELFRFEMNQDVPGNQKWMTACGDVTPVAEVHGTRGTVHLTKTERLIVDYVTAHPNENRMEVQTGLNLLVEVAYPLIARLIGQGVLIEGAYRAGGPNLTVAAQHISQ